MNGRIPRLPEWCSYCIDKEQHPGACPHHIKGPTGDPMPYNGPDVYIPSVDVKDVVGSQYRAHDGRIYLCFGYDPRHGFWVHTVDGGTYRRANISERAIGRTFHRLMAWECIKLPTKR